MNRKFILLLVVLTLVFATGIPFWTYMWRDNPEFRASLEFFLGTWPNQEYSSLTPRAYRENWSYYLGIGLRVLVILLIPVILGYAVNAISRFKREVRMLLKDFVLARDDYLKSEIIPVLLAKFFDPAERQFTIPEDEIGGALEHGFDKGHQEFLEFLKRRYPQAYHDFYAAGAPRGLPR